MIRIWIGGSARSPFRIAQLAQRLAQKGIRPASITAQAVYLVDAEAWAPSDEARLAALVGCPLAPLEAISADARLVIPRFGTVSPWSSKATEILRLCGLACVRRIEHGVLWRFSGLSAEAVDQAARLAMDRMTETFVRSPEEAERLFDAPPPRALAHVPVIEEGRVALERANREMGLALSAEEINYLFDWFMRARRNPTDAELMMFAQANS
ncbi:MAG: phosphoribosylformylglycinamidine synthase, partial [Zetaproteobacteria bacterium]